MYKVIKEKKIVGISENKPNLLDDYEVIEDTEHTCEDFEQVNGEYLLKSEIPAPTEEEQRQKRQQAFTEEADPLRYNYDEDCARYGYDSEQALASKEIWLAKKDEIRERYPYPVENDPEYSILIGG